VVCAFDRHEWGEFGLVDQRILFVDLEGVLPRVPERLLVEESRHERMLFLNEVGGFYKRSSADFVAQAISEARQLNIYSQFTEACSFLFGRSDRDLMDWFNIDPHPLAEMITPYIVEHFRYRLAVAAKLLNKGTYSE
jgi:hypothetical protein